jgi:hypothetical protein
MVRMSDLVRRSAAAPAPPVEDKESHVLVGVLGILAGTIAWRGGRSTPAPFSPPYDSEHAPAAPAIATETAVPPVLAPDPVVPAAPTHDAAETAAAPAVAASHADNAVAVESAASTSRFAVELWPFGSSREARRVEQGMNEAGYASVRLLQPEGTPVPAAGQVGALVRALRDQGFANVTLVGEGAVAAVRVASQPSGPDTLVIRHGSYANREEASAKSEALERLGLTTQIVQVP